MIRVSKLCLYVCVIIEAIHCWYSCLLVNIFMFDPVGIRLQVNIFMFGPVLHEFPRYMFMNHIIVNGVCNIRPPKNYTINTLQT